MGCDGIKKSTSKLLWFCLSWLPRPAMTPGKSPAASERDRPSNIEQHAQDHDDPQQVSSLGGHGLIWPWRWLSSFWLRWVYGKSAGNPGVFSNERWSFLHVFLETTDRNYKICNYKICIYIYIYIYLILFIYTWIYIYIYIYICVCVCIFCCQGLPYIHRLAISFAWLSPSPCLDEFASRRCGMLCPRRRTRGEAKDWIHSGKTNLKRERRDKGRREDEQQKWFRRCRRYKIKWISLK